MFETLISLPTPLLASESERLEKKLLDGATTALETELYIYLQMELGRRLAREIVLDPRD